MGLALALVPGAAAQAAQGAQAAPERALAAPSGQDKQFLQSIHQVNLSEIAVGKLAQQKAVSQQVQDLGARFVADHTKLDETVQQTASKLKVNLPDTPTSEQQAMISQLQKATDSDFDTLFISSQMEAHMQAMRLIETELAQGSDSQVKQVAKSAASIIKAHHEALLAAEQGPMASPSGTGSPSPDETEETEEPTPSES